MAKPHTYLFSLQQLIVDLALIDRNHYLAKTQRRENDIEHSVSVAVLCWFIHDAYQIKLDISKILKYALAHDFIERYAGDTNAFASQVDRAKKLEREKDSLAKLQAEFHEFSDLVAITSAYEAREDEESLFVWTVDKMQALIMGDLDSWRPYKEFGIDCEWFSKKYTDQLTICSPYCKEIFEGLLHYCQSTYYDQPTSTTTQ